MSDLQLSLTVLSVENMGDHGERLPRQYEYVPGETVEALALRLFHDLGREHYRHDPSDVIEIRALIGKGGEVLGEVKSAPGSVTTF